MVGRRGRGRRVGSRAVRVNNVLQDRGGVREIIEKRVRWGLGWSDRTKR